MSRKSSKICDLNAVMQVLGCIASDSNILLDSRFPITVNDMPTKFHKLILSTFINLKESGAETFDVPTVCGYISNYPTHYSLYEKHKGNEYLEAIKANADTRNLDYNFKTMKKFTTLREIYSNGMDISDIFDINETDPTRIEKMNNSIRSMTDADILNHYIGKISSIQTGDSGDIQKFDSGANTREIVRRLKESPIVGLPFVDPILTTAFRGQLLGKMIVESCPTSCVDGDTEYFNGVAWVKMKEYKQGDKVLQYNEDGSATLVTPNRYIKEPCSELYHFENRFINQTLSEEHDMVTVGNDGKPFKMPFVRFKEIHDNAPNGTSLMKIPTAFTYSSEKGIDLSDEEIRLMIAVMADGSFRQDCRPTWCMVNLKKANKKERLIKLLNDCNIEYRYSEKKNGYTIFRFDSPRREKEFLPYWYDCTEHQKQIIIDEIFKWDGTQEELSYYTNSKMSADFIQFVLASTGRRASIKVDDRVGCVKTCKETGKQYTMKNISYVVRWSIGNPNVTTLRSTGKMEITKVASVDGYKYCFTVPSGMLVLRRDNKIFATGNCGKSRKMIANVCNLSIPFRYEPKEGKWIATGIPVQPSLYINTEMSEQEVTTIALAYLTCINEERILLNTLTEEEEKRIDEAVTLMEQYSFKIVIISDYDVDDIQRIITEHIYKYNTRYVYFDYLMGCPKLMSYCVKKSGMALREDQVLLQLSLTLKQFCVKYGVFVYTATQVNASALGEGEEARGVGAVRGSKAIIDKADGGLLVFKPNKKDLDSVKDIIAKKFMSTSDVNYGISIYKNRQGRMTAVYCFYNMDLGTMRMRPLFVTNTRYEPVEVEMLDIVFGSDETVSESVLTKLLATDEQLNEKENQTYEDKYDF